MFEWVRLVDLFKKVGNLAVIMFKVFWFELWVVCEKLFFKVGKFVGVILIGLCLLIIVFIFAVSFGWVFL